MGVPLRFAIGPAFTWGRWLTSWVFYVLQTKPCVVMNAVLRVWVLIKDVRGNPQSGTEGSRGTEGDIVVAAEDARSDDVRRVAASAG